MTSSYQREKQSGVVQPHPSQDESLMNLFANSPSVLISIQDAHKAHSKAAYWWQGSQ